MSTEGSEPLNLEPPKDDNLQVRKELKEILKYFKKCNNFSSDSPVIADQIHKIKNQGEEFHTCLQKSIAQSKNLETHAEGAINYLNALEDPNLDLSQVSDVLETLFENTHQNKEETQKIRDKYDSIKRNLKGINDDAFKREINDKNRLRSLKGDRDGLEGSLKIKSEWNNYYIIGGLFMIILLMVASEGKHDVLIFFLIIGITSIIILATRNFYFKNAIETKIQTIRREISDLELMLNLITSSRQEIEDMAVIKKMDPIINQMGYFNIYWERQQYVLKELSNNLSNMSDQSRKILMLTMRPRWEKVKNSCNEYDITVRNIIEDVEKV